MPFKIKDGASTEGLPTITLAGETYFVERLRLRYRINVSLLTPKLQAFLKEFPKPEDIKAGTTFEFAEEHFRVLLDIVSNGLLGLYPGATRDALLNEMIEFEELFAAWPVVLQQGASRSPPAGEVLAASLTNTTGASSSPTSA
jgi:hypothetical protein